MALPGGAPYEWPSAATTGSSISACRCARRARQRLRLCCATCLPPRDGSHMSDGAAEAEERRHRPHRDAGAAQPSLRRRLRAVRRMKQQIAAPRAAQGAADGRGRRRGRQRRQRRRHGCEAPQAGLRSRRALEWRCCEASHDTHAVEQQRPLASAGGHLDGHAEGAQPPGPHTAAARVSSTQRGRPVETPRAPAHARRTRRLARVRLRRRRRRTPAAGTARRAPRGAPRGAAMRAPQRQLPRRARAAHTPVRGPAAQTRAACADGAGGECVL